MANSKSAIKSYKQADRKRVFNLRRLRVLKETLKGVVSLIQSKDKSGAEAMMPEVFKQIDKAAKKGILEKNTASRKKSRLTAQITKLG